MCFNQNLNASTNFSKSSQHQLSQQPIWWEPSCSHTDIKKMKENEELEECDVLDWKLVTDFSYALPMYHASTITYGYFCCWSTLLLFVLKILALTDVANDIPCICEPANVLLYKPLLEHLVQNPYCQSQHCELDHNQVVFLSCNKHLPLQNQCNLYGTRQIFLFPINISSFYVLSGDDWSNIILLYITACIQCLLLGRRYLFHWQL